MTVDRGVRIDGVSRFTTGPSGSYRGAVLGRWTDGLDRTMLRALYENRGEGSLVERLHEAAEEEVPVDPDAPSTSADASRDTATDDDQEGQR